MILDVFRNTVSPPSPSEQGHRVTLFKNAHVMDASGEHWDHVHQEAVASIHGLDFNPMPLVFRAVELALIVDRFSVLSQASHHRYQLHLEMLQKSNRGLVERNVAKI